MPHFGHFPRPGKIDPYDDIYSDDHDDSKGRHKKTVFLLLVKRGGGLGQSKKSLSEITPIFFTNFDQKMIFLTIFY